MLEIKVVDLNHTIRPEIVGYIRPTDTKMKGQFLHRYSGKPTALRGSSMPTTEPRPYPIRRFGTLFSNSAKWKVSAVQIFHFRLNGWLSKSSDQVTDSEAGESALGFRQGQDFISSPQCSFRLWSPPSPCAMRTGLSQRAGTRKTTGHLHSVSKVKRGWSYTSARWPRLTVGCSAASLHIQTRHSHCPANPQILIRLSQPSSSSPYAMDNIISAFILILTNLMH